jgi:hypothetical protein
MVVVVVVIINLSNMTGNNEIKELQRAARLGSAHLLREDLVHQNKPLNAGDNITCTKNCDYRRAAKPCTLETCFVSCI